MRSILLLLLFSAVAGKLCAQNDSVLVCIQLSDAKSNESIQRVTVALTVDNSDKTNYKTANPEGKVYIHVPNGSILHGTFTHPLYDSYKSTTKILAKIPRDTIKLVINLVPVRVTTLKDVIVKPVGVPDTVFHSTRLSVADFEIQARDKMVLLAYPKTLKKGSELLLYDGNNILHSFSVPGKAEKLLLDFRNNVHVVCEDKVFGIHINEERIGISTLEKEYFFKYIAPIVDTNHTKLYFSNFSKNYPAFNYFTYDQLDTTYTKILHIEDTLMMELYRSEYKWVDVRTKLWAKSKEFETGIDAEIWVGANYFTQSIYYKELYAPLFAKDDTLYVFDYYKDRLFSFDRLGNRIDSIPIYHHYNPKSTGWKKQLIQDRATGFIYALFEKNGYSYLGLIDLKTGDIHEKVRLAFQFVDKISVYDNAAYYIYRPFESIQKKFIYKERLPASF